MTSQQYQDDMERIRPRLLRAARHYLRDADEAEDVAQDVMLKLWSMHEELHPPIDKLALVITKNLCIDRIRRHRPRAHLDEAKASEDEEDDRLEMMQRAINTLPPLQQTILRLRHEEGMETKGIASLMGVSDMAIRKMLSRARMAVRNLLMNNKKR